MYIYVCVLYFFFIFLYLKKININLFYNKIFIDNNKHNIIKFDYLINYLIKIFKNRKFINHGSSSSSS